jgi:parvulin-like peptidyl-prolyl isomerase
MKFLYAALSTVVLLAFTAPANAQEPELVSEIVVRVNTDIITRADYLNALRDFKEELTRQMQQQGKSQADIEAEYAKLKPTILDLLIDDLLVEQKAKELSYDAEADVNQQMNELAKQNNFKNAIDFEKALREQGIDPELLRAQFRKRAQQEYVMQREVLQPIFQSLSEKDRRDFYNRHKEQFTVPGEVTLSEIFLPLEGHTAAEVEQRARRIIAELKAGMDFAEAVQKNSPASRASRAQNGKMGSFKAGELKPELAAAISTLKAGDVTEPIRLQDGFQIIRVDEKKESTVRAFESPEVQNLVGRYATMERAEEARKKYLKKLREDAFIDVNKDYAPTQAKTDKPDKGEKN